MIINSSYFTKGSLYIPNAKGATGAYNASDSGIDGFIDECEEQLLTDALNADLFELVKSSYENGELIAASPDWIDHLINGYKYELDGAIYSFKGIKHPTSCLPFYVFNKHLIDNYGSYGIDGMQRTNNSAATPIDPTPKDVETWNKFVDEYQGHRFHENSLPKITYGTYGTFVDYYGENRQSGTVDLLTFLEDYEKLNEGTYENLNRREYERKNSFGL